MLHLVDHNLYFQEKGFWCSNEGAAWDSCIHIRVAAFVFQLYSQCQLPTDRHPRATGDSSSSWVPARPGLNFGFLSAGILRVNQQMRDVSFLLFFSPFLPLLTHSLHRAPSRKHSECSEKLPRLLLTWHMFLSVFERCSMCCSIPKYL